MHPWNPRFTGWFESTITKAKVRELGRLNRAEMYRYIVLMYNDTSPVHLMTNIDWHAKKFEAAEAAGCELKEDKKGNKRFKAEVVDALIGKNEGVNDLIVDYVAWLNNTVWTELVFLQETAMRYVKESLGGVASDKANIAAVQTIFDRMGKLVKQLTVGEQDTDDIVRRIYYRVEESRLAIRPEEYAQRISEGDDLQEDNPYGGYKPDKIKFIGDKVPTKKRRDGSDG